MLKQFETKLREVADLVFYGSADDVANNTLWEYIVFWRDRTARNQNNTGYTDYYSVAFVSENYVPDEKIEAIIEKIETLPGVRLASSDIDFNYIRKPSTNAVIEIATLTFSRARKRV